MKPLYFPCILTSPSVPLKFLIHTIGGVVCQELPPYYLEVSTFNMETLEFFPISTLCLLERQELEKVLQSNLLKNSLEPLVIRILVQIKQQKKSSLLIYNGKKILTCCIPPSEVTMQQLQQICGEIAMKELRLPQKRMRVGL